jgi:hypothetical protein
MPAAQQPDSSINNIANTNIIANETLDINVYPPHVCPPGMTKCGMARCASGAGQRRSARPPISCQAPGGAAPAPDGAVVAQGPTH